MQYLVAASMVILSGGAHALKGEVVDGARLHKPEELVELGAISPVGETAVAVVQVKLDDATRKQLKELKDKIEGLGSELESLRALKAAMTEEEIEVVQARLDEAKARDEVVAGIKTLNKEALQARAKELELDFTSRTTAEELREAILAKL